MATGGFDAITSDLKNAYPAKNIVPMVNQETPFRRKLKKNLPSGAKFSEGIMKFGGNLAPPQNVGMIADVGTLPAPKDRTSVQFEMTPVIFPGTFQIGWKTKAAANSNKGAFNMGELRRRTEETIADTAKHIERIYCGTHGTGRLGRVSADGSNTITMDLPEGIQLLRENMYISVRTTDGGNTVRDSLDYRKITAINYTTRVVTYDGADQTAVAGDHVHLVTEATQTSLSTIAANGLRGLIDDATYAGSIHGLSRTTYPKLKSNVKSNGGTLRNLTEQILINACHENWQRSGKRVTDAWFNTGQAEKYIEFVSPDRRFPVQGGKVPTYVTGYDEDTMVHVSPGATFKLNIGLEIIPREMYLLNWDTFFHYVAQDMDWWGEGPQLRPVPTEGGYKAGWFAALASIENLGCDMPIGNTVVRDLRDPMCGD